MNEIKPSPRRQQRPVGFAHGWGRRSDAVAPADALQQRRLRLAPAGTSVLLALVVMVVSAAGIVRVRAATRVLELGAEITALTGEQAQLQADKRRLLAERAYLRHPDRIAEVARGKLGMIPVTPDLVQAIRVVDDAPEK
ncbi:MAG: cell division protein FtsL [Deltaproteobacteria bacterium]|nr:cell division protein FtsL [Nannocystaceae bacterium]